MNTSIVRRQTDVTEELANFDPLLQQIYASRGIRSADELTSDLSGLLSYKELSQIDQAVVLLADAIKHDEHILIVGDFDTDGATSTALAISALQAFGAKCVSYVVPNRFEYGYGLTPEIVKLVASKEPDLVVTVDNGIASNEGVSAAKALGIKVLITDHHLPGAELPAADAIINPNQPGDRFLSKNLAGVGVIFYVMLALRAYLRESGWFVSQQIEEPLMVRFLDLVALGTVADMVVLDKNNRIMVKQGLARIRACRCQPGIIELLAVTGRKYESVTANDLAYAVAPRLNAAGRLDDMSLGIECLLAENSSDAREVAAHLDNLNRERRAIEDEMKQEAMTVVSKLHLEDNLPMGLCLYRPEWHQGVVGILASRVKDRTHRPVIAFAKVSDTELKGSARSVAGLHMRDLLDRIAVNHPDLITRFGGHAMAAGLSLDLEKLPKFADTFVEEVAQILSVDDLQGKVHSDGELLQEQFCLTTANLLRDAGPWGQGFPEPLFDNVFKIISQRLLGNRHLKLVLALENSELLLDAIAFNVDRDQWPNYGAEKIHLAYRLDINEYRGRRSLQLLVEQMNVLS